MSLRRIRNAIMFSAAVSGCSGSETSGSGAGTGSADTSVAVDSTLPGESSVIDSPSEAGRRCVADVDGTKTALAGFDVKTVVSGAPLVDPADVAFGFDGKLYVSNSRSVVTTTTDPAPAGEILRVDADGKVSTYLADTRLRGPHHMAFVPGGVSGGPGILHVGLEDLRDSLVSPTDVVFSYDGTTGSLGPAAFEPTGVQRGPGGVFGDFVYYVSRENGATAPSPYLLFRIESGVRTKVAVVNRITSSPLTGAFHFDWGHGGSLGNDLYLGTFDDPLSNLSEHAIWRVDASLKASRFVVAESLISAIAASPSAGGAFGDFVYFGMGKDLKRVDVSGQITTVATGFGDLTGMEFGPDGALYIADAPAHRVRRVAVCAP